MSDPTTDEQVRADDAARGADDATETRAVANAAPPVSRRAQSSEKVKRAESRGIYRDPITQARRVVGQGQVIPDGWTRIESGSLEDRGVTHSREVLAGDVTATDPVGSSGAQGKPKAKAKPAA